MLKIGELSYLYNVSSRTLRYYDEIGLLKPSMVDKFSGYRYYNENKKKELERILELKNLGFTIDEILNNKDIDGKLKDLYNEKKDINEKINKISTINNDLKIGFDFYTRYFLIGRHITIHDRSTNLNKYYNELDSILSKYKKDININFDVKVIIEEEIEYKEEDIDLYIGYNCTVKKGVDFSKIKKKMAGDDLYFEGGAPHEDHIVCYDIEENDVENSIKRIINYCDNNKLEIVSGFYKVYDDLGLHISCCFIDIERIDYRNYYRNKHLKDIYNNLEFKENKALIGKWKIRDVLPNIHFNPNKTKGNIDIELKNIEFLDNGLTNYAYIKWSGNTLYINRDNKINAVLIEYFERDGVNYIELRMSDISSDIRCISFIYEKI